MLEESCKFSGKPADLLEVLCELSKSLTWIVKAKLQRTPAPRVDNLGKEGEHTNAKEQLFTPVAAMFYNASFIYSKMMWSNVGVACYMEASWALFLCWKCEQKCSNCRPYWARQVAPTEVHARRKE